VLEEQLYLTCSALYTEIHGYPISIISIVVVPIAIIVHVVEIVSIIGIGRTQPHEVRPKALRQFYIDFPYFKDYYKT